MNTRGNHLKSHNKHVCYFDNILTIVLITIIKINKMTYVTYLFGKINFFIQT